MNLNGAFKLPKLSTFFFFVVSLNSNVINGECEIELSCCTKDMKANAVLYAALSPQYMCSNAPLSRPCHHPCSDGRRHFRRSTARCHCSRERTSSPSRRSSTPRQRETWGSASPSFGSLRLLCCYHLPAADSRLGEPWQRVATAASTDGRPDPRSIKRNFRSKMA